MTFRADRAAPLAPRLAALAAAAAWATLAAGKVLAGARTGSGLAARLPGPLAGLSDGLAAAVLAAEGLLGAVLVLAALAPGAGISRRLGLAFWGPWASAALAALLGTLAALEPVGLAPCGCFGALAASTRARRLLVAGVLLWLSLAARIKARPPSPAAAGRCRPARGA